MINYVEKGYGMHIAVNDAGHFLKEKDGVWLSDDDPVVQVIIDNYDPVPYSKEQKIIELKAEAVRRAQIPFPAILDFDTLDIVRQIMLSVTNASRIPTADITTLTSIYTAGSNAGAVVNGMIDPTAIDAYDVVNTPSWP